MALSSGATTKRLFGMAAGDFKTNNHQSHQCGRLMRTSEKISYKSAAESGKFGNLTVTFVLVLIILALPREQHGGLMSGGATVASGFLQDVGQFSQMMSEFVDALLEKVSFLAEIIIDSSMSEQCEFTCASIPEDAIPNNGTFMELGGARPGRNRIFFKREDQFDADEFNVDVHTFIESLKQSKRQKRQADSNCRLFNLIDVSRQDLPVGEMELCCKQFHDCYDQCNKQKLACDAELQVCFNSLCKDKFNYKNMTLVYHYNQHLMFAKERDNPQNEPLTINQDPLDADSADELAVVDEKSDNKGEPKTSEREQEEDKWKQPNVKQVKRVKDKYKACKLASKVLIIGNLAFGCMSYKEAQRAACCNKTTQA